MASNEYNPLINARKVFEICKAYTQHEAAEDITHIERRITVVNQTSSDSPIDVLRMERIHNSFNLLRQEFVGSEELPVEQKFSIMNRLTLIDEQLKELEGRDTKK